jgi:hypothetical protein
MKELPSHRYGCADGGVGVVALEGKVLELVRENVGRLAGNAQPWQGAGLATQLLVDDLVGEVIVVEVKVTKGVNEFSDLQFTLLGDHVGEKCVAGNVEGDSQEAVGAALVELAGESPFGHKELEQAVAWGKGHATLLNIGLG